MVIAVRAHCNPLDMNCIMYVCMLPCFQTSKTLIEMDINTMRMEFIQGY